MKPSELPEVPISPGDLLVFIDDTGHESFLGNHEHYGLGGCVMQGSAYPQVRKAWCDVREQINGSPDKPLHGLKLKRTPDNFAVLKEFFQNRLFARVAVTSVKSTPIPPGMHPAAPVTAALQEDIAHLARIIPCSAVKIIVESSERADAILKQCFVELVPEGGGMALPVYRHLMPKSGGEPALEIADFIVGAAGSQVQRYVRGQTGFALDFQDIFCQLPSYGCLHSVITKVRERDAGVNVVMDRLPLVGDAHRP